MVRPEGIEPPSTASKAAVLSVKLRAHLLRVWSARDEPSLLSLILQLDLVLCSSSF